MNIEKMHRRQLLACIGCTILQASCGVKPTDSSVDDTGAEPSLEDWMLPINRACEEESEYVVDSSWTELSLSQHVALQSAGGFSIVTVSGRSLIVARIDQSCVVALSSACTHEGETLRYQSQMFRFVCPRHGATFSVEGDVQAGPTAVAIQKFPAVLESGRIWVKV